MLCLQTRYQKFFKSVYRTDFGRIRNFYINLVKFGRRFGIASAKNKFQGRNIWQDGKFLIKSDKVILMTENLSIFIITVNSLSSGLIKSKIS